MNRELNTIATLCTGITEQISFKSVTSFATAIFGFLFGFSSGLILKALFALIIFDFFTGMLAAYKTGQHIESRKAVRSAFKIAIYGLLVSAGHIIGNLLANTTFIEQGITAFLGLTELISIIENVGKMGFAVPQLLLNRLQNWRDGKEEIIIQK